MQQFGLGYREVIPDQTVSGSWKEISLNTGGTQGTLQDIKVAERANGFCYRDSSKHHTRNRFIYWRISHNVLELVEHSLDVNLAGNRIRYRFVDTPILDGVSIHETFDNVIVLVPTVCSVHRLIFPHPDKYHRPNDILGIHPDLAAPSIFSEATAAEARDPARFHFFTNPSTSSSQLPYLADSSLTLTTEEAIFVLAYPSGEVLLVKQSKEGKVESVELKSESIVPRILSGITNKLWNKDKDGDTTVSLLLHTFSLETYALTLCRNGQLKFWSCSKAECVSAIDVVSEIGLFTRNQIQGAQNHILRKAVDGYDTECYLAISMSFINESQLHIFKPVVNGSQIRLNRLSTLHLAQNDLIDFALSTKEVWSVWRGKDGECEVYTAALKGCDRSWIPVVLEGIPDASQPPNIDGEVEPRQVYLQYIFQPGRFPLHVISKALNIYKKSAIISDLSLSPSNLKQQICMAIDDEIQNELKETVVSDEDYLECANYCWQRFYSCCVQYYVAGLKPLGLMLLQSGSGAVLLKKSLISFLRPLDILEQLMFQAEDACVGQFSKHFQLAESNEITEDIINLFQAINYLEQQMSESFAYAFEKELSMLKSPDVVMSAFLQKILCETDNEFTEQVSIILSRCSDLYQAMHKALELFRMEHPSITDEDAESQLSINHIFTSALGVSVISGCLKQQSEMRFNICRNLLLITHILLVRSELDWNLLEAIRSVCAPELVVLTQANYAMVWFSNLTALPILPDDDGMQRLSSLKLSPVYNLRTSSLSTISLLELFAGSTGGYEARKAFARLKHDEESLAKWQSSLLSYLDCLFHVVWPITGGAVLAEWLLTSGQQLWLQQYVRYLKTWCEWNSCTHDFLLATSLLATGEAHKAEYLFITAAKGIFTDEFLSQRLLAPSDGDQRKAYVNYYLKVIHLFELHKAYDCALSLANTGLAVTPRDDPLAATLYSIKFKLHLVLKNYEMAYNAMNSNPDSERKKDSLRDLVKHLFEERKLDILMHFIYGGMQELFTEIVFTRARATEPLHNIYYDFLFAHYVKMGPTFSRLAASVMFERALRLKQCSGVDALEQRVKSLLIANNSLQLCDIENAYVVMPVDQVDETFIELPVFTGSKAKPETFVLRRQVEIYDCDQVEKELKFAMATLELYRFKSQDTWIVTTPNELVVLQAGAGLYKRALEIAKLFEVPYDAVFQSLTGRCIILTKETAKENWDWLLENDVQDLPPNIRSAADASWNLLEKLLQEYEEKKMSILHKVVANQLLKKHMWIPSWLLSSYKKRNPSELFRLYFSAGRLDEAVEIGTEYMKAALGYGKENYGFEYALQPTKPSFCLPIMGFEALLRQLSTINQTSPDKPYLEEESYLREVFKIYLDTAHKCSLQISS